MADTEMAQATTNNNNAADEEPTTTSVSEEEKQDFKLELADKVGVLPRRE